MTIDNSRLRTEVLNIDVITRSTGKKLGVVKELLVDIDRREVVAIGLRDNRFAVSGLPKYLYLTNVSQTGDVILVEDEDVIEDVDVEIYSQLVNSEVITETGEPLGRVRDFQYNPLDGRVSSIIIASIGYHQIPEQLISTYELSMDEVISGGPNRLIVFESAEDRLTQLSVGLLERLGVGKPPWEKEAEESYYPPVTPAENQLPSRIPVRTPVMQKVEDKVPVSQENWSDDDWEDPYASPTPQKQAESIRYPEYEEDEQESNWDESEDYQAPPRVYEPINRQPDYDYDEEANDIWDDDQEPQPLQAPRINLTDKQKQPEYEEEEEY